jgi:HK97 family phage portal protein
VNILAKFGLWLYRSTSNTANPQRWLLDLFGGSESTAGIRVGADSAQGSPTVNACVQVAAQDWAKLPLPLYRRRPDGSGRDKAVDHPAYKLVTLRPNSRQTSYEWREMMQAHFELRGNCYSRVIRDFKFRPIELIPLHPDWVTPMRSADGTPFYKLRMFGTGAEETLKQHDMLHIRDRSDDGYIGKSQIERARDLIGLNIAGQRHASKIFANGARLSGVISLKGQVDKPGRDLAKQEFRDAYAGTGSRDYGGVAVFAEEGSFAPVSMTQADLEFVEQMKLTRQELAAVFRIPPHMVGIMDNATFSNIEHQRLEYVQDKLMPVARRWEQALAVTLLRESELDEYYFEANFDAMLRGDTLARMQAMAIGRQWGLYSVNDWCDMENRNHVAGGDERLTPLNMWPLGEPRPEKTLGSQPDTPPGKAYEDYARPELRLIPTR